MTSRSLTHPTKSLMMSGCTQGALLKLGIGSSYFASIEALGRATSTKKIMRALNANTDSSSHGVLTSSPGVLDNSFFVNLVDMSIQWAPSSEEGVYEGRERGSDALLYTATPVDLIFGSNSELRAISEFYAADDAKEEFVEDFVAAWAKVMTLDRFDLDSQ